MYFNSTTVPGPIDKKPRTFPRGTPQREIDQVLIHYHQDMLNGVRDESISEETGIPLRRVQDYRRDHVIKKRTRIQSLRGAEEKYQAALDIFGDKSLPEFMTRVASPVLDHRWEPPTFVRRVPLNYDSMCFGMYQLYRFGMSVGQLASAFGFLEEDIEDAIRLYMAYLDRSGVICPKCKDALIDPAQQNSCIPPCTRKGARR